ncbi:MAG: DegT/DnrJ/EryC1/StrS family aminotransferase [Candidatus Sumerlaeota bacterium]|nr:DegT/DnrJ/EryC1/StrS family aminotransferase [Candidatus Sumerlaeota bacterium]
MFRCGQEEIAEVTKVLQSRQWFRIGNPSDGHLGEVDKFEAEWAQMIGSRYALLMCGGGTAALVCGLAAMGVGPGDEVLVPAYTWMATATSVLTAGAIPVLTEVDETLAMDPDDVERKLSPRVKAIIPVHMMGRPANLERLTAIAARHKIQVLEDSCQMDGGSYKGRRTGSWGAAGAFSFNWYKIISGGGEGGCLVTNDREIYERAFVFHDSGANFRPMAAEIKVPIFVAQQYRADEVMAAILRMQLRRLDGILGDCRRIRNRVAQELTGAPGIRFSPNNDPEGDCGLVLPFRFDTPEQTARFAEKTLAGGGRGYIGINHGKHVYTEWEPLRAKRIMHHPRMNPFNFEENQGLRADYGPETCPRTLAHLRRVFFLTINPDWTEAEIARVIKACRHAAAEIA